MGAEMLQKLLSPTPAFAGSTLEIPQVGQPQPSPQTTAPGMTPQEMARWLMQNSPSQGRPPAALGLVPEGTTYTRPPPDRSIGTVDQYMNPQPQRPIIAHTPVPVPGQNPYAPLNQMFRLLGLP